MYKDILIIIPARGGSKGIPKKNIKDLGDKPLIQYTVEVALSILPKEQICVSTDSVEIKTIVESLGIDVPFLRPNILANDTATSEDVLKHALGFYKDRGLNYKKVILLQPTSPFRTVSDVKNALELYNDDLDMVVSVKETDSNPYYVLFEESKEGYLEKSKKGEFTRRQDVPTVYEFNGAIYIINTSALEKKGIKNFDKIKKYVMDKYSSIDIDDELDWLVAESVLKIIKINA